MTFDCFSFFKLQDTMSHFTPQFRSLVSMLEKTHAYYEYFISTFTYISMLTTVAIIYIKTPALKRSSRVIEKKQKLDALGD
jgi:ABC-type amino acid transport system permease subunit